MKEIESKVIHKYPLEITDYQTIKVPYGAKILCVQIQNNKANLWIEKNVYSDRFHIITINIFGTGHQFVGVNSDLNSSPLYIGTVQINDFVFHVYENGRKEE